MHKVRTLLVYATLFSFSVPIVAWFSFFGVPLWSIPFTLLVLCHLPKLAVSKKARHLSVDIYDVSALLFASSMILSTVFSPPDVQLGVNKLTVYIASLFIFIYTKNYWGREIYYKSIVKFTYVFVIIQFTVSAIQFATGTPWGSIPAYIGGVQSDSIGGGLVQRYYGVDRVVGTLGRSPNILANAITVLCPFVIFDHNVVYETLGRSIGRLTKLLVSSMVFLVVLMTLSRASMLVLAVLFVVYFVRTYGKKSRASFTLLSYAKSYLLYTCLLLVLVLVFSFRSGAILGTSSTIQEAVSFRWSLVGESEFVTGPIEDRLNQVNAALELYKEENAGFLGIGFWNSDDLGYKTQTSLNRPEIRPHNAYVITLLEGGVLSLVPYLIITILPLVTHLVRWEYDSDPQVSTTLSHLAIIAFLLTTVAHNGVALAPIYFLLVGASVGQSRIINYNRHISS